MELLFLQSGPSGNTEDIWKWIASGLLAILGWLLGKKDRRDNLGENSWEKRGAEVLLRIQQLEELNKLRTDNPETHPLTNHVNSILGRYELRIMRMEDRMENGMKRLKEETGHERRD